MRVKFWKTLGHCKVTAPGQGHRHSQGVQWVHLRTQGGEEKFPGLIYRKNVKVHPQPEQESIFRTVFLLGGLDLEVYLDDD